MPRCTQSRYKDRASSTRASHRAWRPRTCGNPPDLRRGVGWVLRDTSVCARETRLLLDQDPGLEVEPRREPEVLVAGPGVAVDAAVLAAAVGVEAEAEADVRRRSGSWWGPAPQSPPRRARPGRAPGASGSKRLHRSGTHPQGGLDPPPGGRLHGGNVVVAGGVFSGADQQAVDEERGIVRLRRQTLWPRESCIAGPNPSLYSVASLSFVVMANPMVLPGWSCETSEASSSS